MNDLPLKIKMKFDKLTCCLNQKQVLLNKICNLSKQIEVLCNTPDFDLGDLAAQRQVYIDRLKRCEELITELVSQLSSGEQERIRQILSARLRKDDCNSEEAVLYDYGVKCRSILRNILAMDRESIKKVRSERDRLRELSNRSRGKEQTAQIFHPGI